MGSSLERRQVGALDRRGEEALASSLKQARREAERVSSDLAREMEERISGGLPVSPAWMHRSGAYRELLRRVAQDSTAFARTCARDSEANQRALIDRALSSALARVERVSSRAVIVAPSELEGVVGRLPGGGHASSLFKRIGPRSLLRIRRDLAVAAVASRPEMIEKAVRDAYNSVLSSAITIRRTEGMRAYRAASTRAYRKNRHAFPRWYRRAVLDGHTCAVCWALHGTVHEWSEGLWDHPRGRCMQEPMEEGDRAPSGAEEFERLEERERERILGKGLFREMKERGLSLQDLIVESPSRWGRGWRLRRLEEVVSEKPAKGLSFEERLLSSEAEISSESVEHLIVFDSRGREIYRTTQDEEMGVGFGDDFKDWDLLKGSTITHNHPPRFGAGSSFSSYDFKSALRHQPAELRAVNEWYTYYLRPGKEGWGIWAEEGYDEAIEWFHHFEDQVKSEFQGRVRRGEIGLEEARRDALHEARRRTAAKLGLEYGRIER